MTQQQYEKMLPDFMRDFHDQKDLFKAIHSLYSRNPDNKIPCNWVDNHVWTIDFFLWFMADHGYTLQKYRGKTFKACDIHKTIKDERDRKSDLISSILNNSNPHP